MKVFISQSLAPQARKGEQLVSMMPASEKPLHLLGDDIVELSTENESLKKIGSFDEKRLEESKVKLLKHVHDRASFFMPRISKNR